MKSFIVHRHHWSPGYSMPVGTTFQFPAPDWATLCQTLNAWNCNSGNNSTNYWYYCADPQEGTPLDRR